MAACHGVIARIAPTARVIDVTHLVPPADVRRGAAVLAQTVPYLPVGVHVAVVDPGVGTARRGIALAALFNPAMRAVKEQLYQSERPWVVDSTKFERTFGWTATPLRDAVAATVAWFQGQTAD